MSGVCRAVEAECAEQGAAPDRAGIPVVRVFRLFDGPADELSVRLQTVPQEDAVYDPVFMSLLWKNP